MKSKYRLENMCYSSEPSFPLLKTLLANICLSVLCVLYVLFFINTYILQYIYVLDNKDNKDNKDTKTRYVQGQFSGHEMKVGGFISYGTK